MKTRTHTKTKPTLAAIAGLALAASSAFAGNIDIDNNDFEDDFGGDWASFPGWNEGANSYIETSGGSKILYLGATGKVDQDLSHTWSSGETFSLSLTGHEPDWAAAGTNSFSVQLREADGTLLWDSGSQSVDDFATANLFEWTTIFASTDFVGGTAGQQLNIQLQGTVASSFLDDVSLSVDTVPEPTTTALLGLGGLALILRRRK